MQKIDIGGFSFSILFLRVFTLFFHLFVFARDQEILQTLCSLRSVCVTDLKSHRKTGSSNLLFVSQVILKDRCFLGETTLRARALDLRFEDYESKASNRPR